MAKYGRTKKIPYKLKQHLKDSFSNNVLFKVFNPMTLNLIESNNQYSGIFNWHGENHNFGTEAPSDKNAKTNMMFQLAKKLKIHVGAIQNYYRSHPDGFTIKKIR